jgi:hypothetical protein
VNLGFVDLGILEDFLNGFDLEKILAKFLQAWVREM